MDMGLTPDLLPGYRPVSKAGLSPGLSLPEILDAPDLDVLWVIGANPLAGAEPAAENAFLVVQDLFLTETARRADAVLPAASLYEKTGTATNVCGELQRLRKAVSVTGAKTDLEIFGLIAREMKLDLGPAEPDAVFEEIRRSVAGYAVPEITLALGGAAPTSPPVAEIDAWTPPELVRSARDTLFTSGTLGRYSKILGSVIESPGSLYGS